MPRFINPVPKYTDASGNFMPYGLVYFFDTGTNDDKTTFADSDQTIANPQPLILNGDGSTPNCFYTGAAKVILVTNAGTQAAPVDGVQQWERDPVSTGDIVALAWGVYNFATDTLLSGFGCTVVRLIEGSAVLTLATPLSSLTAAASFVHPSEINAKGSINFTSQTSAILTASSGRDTPINDTILNGTTSIAIPYSITGSTATVSKDLVQVSAHETLGSAKDLYVSATSSTTITIACDVNPGKDVDFGIISSSSTLLIDDTQCEFVIYDTGL